MLDGRVGLDAGSLASGQTLEEQSAIESILVSHAHLDHVGDLGALCDTRLQQGGQPLEVHALPETLGALRTHYFNDVLWPDFARLPSAEDPTLCLRQVNPEQPFEVAGLAALAVEVHHSVPSAGFLVGPAGEPYRLAYSGDTGPTDRFWTVLRQHTGVRALITEVSFPDRMADLAQRSGHLTTAGFAAEMEKLAPGAELRILIYGMKPAFVDEIEAEVKALDLGAELLRADTVLEL